MEPVVNEMSQAERTGQRDGAEFDEFYRAEAAGQVRRAALLVGSDEAANDIVHDALTAMYRRWGEVDDPGPYLNRAVLNGCRDHARRRGTQRRLIGRLRPVDGSDHRGEPDVLDDILGRLPFNQRATIVLRYYAGCTTSEIAELLGCSTGSVGPWIDRALRTLRKELS